MVGEERGERRNGMGSTDEGESESDGGGAEQTEPPLRD